MWEEAQFHQLDKSDQPMHSSYDSDDKSLKNLESHEGLEVDDHGRIVVLPFQKDILPKNALSRQHDDLHTDFSSFNQSISFF